MGTIEFNSVFNPVSHNVYQLQSLYLVHKDILLTKQLQWMDARRPVPRLWIRSAEERGERRYENGNTTTISSCIKVVQIIISLTKLLVKDSINLLVQIK